MVRLVWVILISAPFVIYYIWRVWYVEKHAVLYSERQRYTIAQRMIRIMKNNGFIYTRVYGSEKLPSEGGYCMYANHQGKYDALGIIFGHAEPCTVLIDEKTCRLPFVGEFIRLLRGTTLDRDRAKSQITAVRRIINEVKEGRRYIIFPEGGYGRNRNRLQEFMPGSFKCAVRSRQPIVPVALINSYKVFSGLGLGPVFTQVHFLDPIYYEDYKGKSTKEIADLVKGRIEERIAAFA